MDLKKTILGLLGLNGLALATTFILGFLYFGIWVMPPNITKADLNTQMNQAFYLCKNSSIQTAYCPLFSINQSSDSMNATLNVTWTVGNGTVCTVKLTEDDTTELADFSRNTQYTLPDGYPVNSTFGLRITRIYPRAGNCNFVVDPVN